MTRTDLFSPGSIEQAPTVQPSGQPSNSPTDPSTTTMTINGDLTLEGVAADCPLTTSKLEAVKESVKKSVESLACNQQNTKNGTSCKANATSVSCTEGKRLLSLRRLNTASLVVKYEIIFKAVCETFDCTTAEATGNALYKQVSGDITNAINDGTLVKKLKASDPVAASVFQSVTRIQNQLEPVIIPILASFIWYPDWIGRSGKCLNDGAYFILYRCNLSVHLLHLNFILNIYIDVTPSTLFI